jgi:hypothetical protein
LLPEQDSDDGIGEQREHDQRWPLRRRHQRQTAEITRLEIATRAGLCGHGWERGRFPRGANEIEAQGIAALSRQLDIPAPTANAAFLTGRTAERFRAEIRTRFGFREATVADAEQLLVWLRDHDVAAEVGGELEPMLEQLEGRCRALAIEPPTPERMERIARSALRAHEDRFHTSVHERLPPATRERLDALLYPEKIGADTEDAQGPTTDRTPTLLVKLRDDPGRPSLASLQDALAKLERLRGIDLPTDLFNGVSPQDLERSRQRVSVEVPRDLRRHPEPARLTWLAAFVHLRVRTSDRRPRGSAHRDHPQDRCARRAQGRARAAGRPQARLRQTKPAVRAGRCGAGPAGRRGARRRLSRRRRADLAEPGQGMEGHRTDLSRHLRAVIRNSYRGHYRRMVPGYWWRSTSAPTTTVTVR